MPQPAQEPSLFSASANFPLLSRVERRVFLRLFAIFCEEAGN